MNDEVTVMGYDLGCDPFMDFGSETVEVSPNTDDETAAGRAVALWKFKRMAIIKTWTGKIQYVMRRDSFREDGTLLDSFSSRVVEEPQEEEEDHTEENMWY